jgi:predicted nucleotidyltransferase
MSTAQALVFDQTRLKAVADRLKQHHAAQRVILFGSAARGQATGDSDIDLLIISPSTEKLYRRMASVLRAVRDLSYGLPLAPIVLTPEELQIRLDRGDQFVQEILTTGVEL